MAVFYRIVQAEWSPAAMTGEGGRLFGGRWNPPGIPAVYLAESRALAALEIIVHAPREVIALDWHIIEVNVPEKCIQSANRADLPTDWQALPSSPGARNFGATWLRRHMSLALKIPSVIIPEEHTLLFNPLHPDASQVKIATPRVFRFDPRF